MGYLKVTMLEILDHLDRRSVELFRALEAIEVFAALELDHGRGSPLRRYCQVIRNGIRKDQLLFGALRIATMNRRRPMHFDIVEEVMLRR